MTDYLKETAEKDKKIISIFEKYYYDILTTKRDGDFTDGEEYLLNEYLSAMKRQDRRVEK